MVLAAVSMIVPPALRARVGLEHGERIAAELSPLAAGADRAMPWCGFLFLCFTNRCGSNYLAAVLAASGALNEAGEFFNADTVLSHAAARGFASLRAYVAALPALVGVPAVPGRWLAAKASVDQLMMLTDAAVLEDVRARAKFILMERRDRLGQAISRAIAVQTLQWTTLHPRAVPDEALVYDRASILRHMAAVDGFTAGFYSFFAANGIVPLHLVYEDVVADPAGAVRRVGAWMGLGDLGFDPARVRIGRQSNAVNAAWRARFLAGE